MAKKEILIPYERDGSIPWEHPWGEYRWDMRQDDYVLKPDTKYDWRKPEPFRARLQFHKIITIRSGYTVRMMNADTGAVYPMKGEQFLELISDMVYGVLPVMVWKPYRVGSNYNIRRVTED
jgi:hypothetical protein